MDSARLCEMVAEHGRTREPGPGAIAGARGGVKPGPENGKPRTRTMVHMLREDLIRYARRDWTAVQQAKQLHWLRQKREVSAVETLRRADDRLRHARAAGCATPSVDERLDDLRVHHRIGLALRAVTRPAR